MIFLNRNLFSLLSFMYLLIGVTIRKLMTMSRMSTAIGRRIIEKMKDSCSLIEVHYGSN